MAETKYGKHLVTIPFHKTPKGALFATGGDILGGLELNVIYACGYETGITGLSTKPHVHNYDEAVFFIGSDPYNLDDLGAEVEISIGEPGQEEKHTFDKPTVLVAPRGLYHCPIVTRKIDKPYVCMAVSLTGKRAD
ncbi:MAG: hypothetical protein KAS25_04070 [Dehalococcoidales bacterium]|nr:hypothetical protein [Dehalococcoidales bacterium]